MSRDRRTYDRRNVWRASLSLFLAIVLSTTPLIGCMGYVDQQGDVSEFVERESPKIIRVSSDTKGRVVIYWATVEGDSLVGHIVEKEGRRMHKSRTAVDSSSVWRFQTRTLLVGWTIAGVAGAIGGLLLFGEWIERQD